MSGDETRKERPLVTLKGVGTIASTPGATAPDTAAETATDAAAPALRVPSTEPTSAAPGTADAPPPAPMQSAPPAPPPGPSRPDARSPYLPLALGLAAVLTSLCLQSWNLWNDRQALQQARSNQQPLLERAEQATAALNGLKTELQQLADKGHPLASQLTQELTRRP